MYVSVFLKISVIDKKLSGLCDPDIPGIGVLHYAQASTPMIYQDTHSKDTRVYIRMHSWDTIQDKLFILYMFWSHIVAYQLSRDNDLGTTSKHKGDWQLTCELYYKVLSNIYPDRCQHLKIAPRIILYIAMYSVNIADRLR